MADSDWVDDPSPDSDWVDDPPAKQKHWYDVDAKGLARGAIDALPIAGAAAGGFLGSAVAPIAGTVGGSALGYAGGQELAGILKNKLLGDQAPSVDPMDQVNRVGSNLAKGATYEMGGQSLVKGLELGKNYLGDSLGNAAEKLAVNATGATGKQASEFSDDAGRQLLDRKLVRFGDNAKNIAERTGQAMDTATSNIDTALKGLDAKGVSVSVDDIVGELQGKVAQLEKDPSQAGVVKKLKSIIDDIYQSGESAVPASVAEQTKRGFNKMAGNWMDPEVGQAGKTAYQAYRHGVESAAESADPALSSLFQEGKETYGLLAPIEEAATRRASTVNQSPFGGLGDWASIGAGGAAGGGPGAMAALAAKKFVAPRVTSSAAVTLDSVSKMLMKSPQLAEMATKNPQVFNLIAKKMTDRMTPQMPLAADKDQKPFEINQIIQKVQGTKYASVLQNAAQKGDKAFNAAYFILQSKDPEFRQALQSQGDQ